MSRSSLPGTGLPAMIFSRSLAASTPVSNDGAPPSEDGAEQDLTPEEAKIVSLLGLTENQRKAIRKMKGTCR